MESISSIKADMSRLKETELPEFISKYKDDSRAGVIAIVKRAEKNISRMKMNLKELMNFRLLKGNIVIINIFAVLMK